MKTGIEEAILIGDRYQARFGNLTDIAHPSIVAAPAFIQLLKSALTTGAVVTQEMVEAVFPDVPAGWID